MHRLLRSNDSGTTETNYDTHKKENPMPQVHTVPLYRGISTWAEPYGGFTYSLDKLSYFSSLLTSMDDAKTKSYDKYDKKSFGPYQDCKGVVVKNLYMPDHFLGVHALGFSYNRPLLAVGTGDGGIIITDFIRSHEHEVQYGTSDGRAITSCKFHPTVPDLLFCSSKNGMVYRCEDNNESPKYVVWESSIYIIEADETNAMDISCTGNYLATAGKNPTVRVYDIEAHKLTMKFPSYDENCKRIQAQDFDTPEDFDGGHCMRIMALKADRENNDIFFTGGWDCTVKIWDMRAGPLPVRTCHGPFICGDALDVMDNKILTAKYASQRSVELWDMGSGRKMAVLNPTNRPKIIEGEFFYTAKFYYGFVYPEPVTFMKSDLVIVGGAGMDVVEIISINENKVLKAFPAVKPVSSIATLDTKIAYGSSAHHYSIAGFVPFWVQSDTELPEETEEKAKEEEQLEEERLRELEEKQRAEELLAAQNAAEEEEEELVASEEDTYESPPED